MYYPHAVNFIMISLDQLTYSATALKEAELFGMTLFFFTAFKGTLLKNKMRVNCLN
jgi:hypothetical protein